MIQETKTKVRINLNETARFRLTSSGIVALERYWFEHAQSVKMPLAKVLPKPDANGVYEMQLWQLMEQLGATMQMTAPTSIEHLEIEVEVTGIEQSDKTGNDMVSRMLADTSRELVELRREALRARQIVEASDRMRVCATQLLRWSQQTGVSEMMGRALPAVELAQFRDLVGQILFESHDCSLRSRPQVCRRCLAQLTQEEQEHASWQAARLEAVRLADRLCKALQTIETPGLVVAQLCHLLEAELNKVREGNGGCLP